MKKFIVSTAVFAVLAAPAAAQVTTPGDTISGKAVTSGHGSFYLQPYAGYMVFGELADFGNDVDLSNENSPLYGVQAGYSFSPNLSLVGNFGYSKSKSVLKFDSAPDQNLSGDLGVFLYDASLQFRLPFIANALGSTIAPFAQVGAGAIKVTTDSDDLRGSGPTNVAFNAGLGVDFQIRKAIGIRLMAKDYITSLDWKEFDDVDNEIRSGRKNNVANNIAITAGLNFGF